MWGNPEGLSAGRPWSGGLSAGGPWRLSAGGPWSRGLSVGGDYGVEG